MSDHTSPARLIAEEKGCSIATVNAKAKAVGINIKGRSPDGHQLLMDALKDVKPRKKIAPPTTPEAAKKTARRSAKKANPKKGADLDLNGFFNQGKVYISEINKRLAAMDKEKAMLAEQLEKLYALHPGMKK